MIWTTERVAGFLRGRKLQTVVTLTGERLIERFGAINRCGTVCDCSLIPLRYRSILKGGDSVRGGSHTADYNAQLYIFWNKIRENCDVGGLDVIHFWMFEQGLVCTVLDSCSPRGLRVVTGKRTYFTSSWDVFEGGDINFDYLDEHPMFIENASTGIVHRNWPEIGIGVCVKVRVEGVEGAREIVTEKMG